MRLALALLLPLCAHAREPVPTVAVLATAPGDAASTLHFVAAGASALPPAVATLPHLPWGVVRASMLPGGRPVAPFARDFSVDERGRLVYANRAGGQFTVERIDPKTGAREILASGVSSHAAPHAWPGAPLWNDGDRGLTSLGAGVDVVCSLSP